MRERIVGFITLGVAVVLFVTATVLVLGRDNKGPEIIVPSGMSYNDKQSMEVLLDGVTAIDKRDGDVSDTLVVESLIVLEDGGRAKVTYVARDRHNNVSYANAVISYTGKGDNVYSTFSAADNTTADESTTDSGNMTTQTTQGHTEESTSESAEADTTENGTTADDDAEAPSAGADSDESGSENASFGKDDAIEEESSKESQTEKTTAKNDSEEPETETTTVNDNVPVLKLSQNETTIKKGELFKVFKFVESITDDKDDRDYLYERISIQGQYDIYTPGDYELYIYCVDSDRNSSNKERFILHVVEQQSGE